MGILTVRNNLRVLIHRLKVCSERGDVLASQCLRLLLSRADNIVAFHKQRADVPLELCLSYLKEDMYLRCY